MDDLIEALTILRKYGNPENPTYCAHDELYFCVDPTSVAPADINRLRELDVLPDFNQSCFYSFRYGSA